MLEPGFAERVKADYQTRRAALAVRLDARLAAATTTGRATRAAAKSLDARCEAARKAIGEALEARPGAVASATDLEALFDRLVAGETASCINAVAMVAARWDDPAATMQRTHAAVVRAYENGREDAVRHLADAANESRERLRPLPLRLVRGGLGTLVGGGLLWRGGLWVSQHWPQIAAHLHH
jgi:hypothetical protein